MTDRTTSTSDRMVPGRGLIINILCQVGFGLMAMTICLPSVPMWADLFAENPATVQLTFSVYLMAFALAQLVYGPLSDQFGRRRMLISGLVIAFIGSALSAYAMSIEMLILGRTVQGAGTAAGMVIGRAMVQDLFEGSARTRMMAYIGASMGLLPPAATIIGGQIHVYFGWSANFLLIMMVNLFLMAAAWWGLPKRTANLERADNVLRGMLKGFRDLLAIPQYLAYVVIVGGTFGAFYAFIAGAPVVLDAYGVGPSQVGWFIMFVPTSYVVGNLLTSRLVDRVSEGRLMIVGQILTVCGILSVLILAWAGVHSPFAVTPPLMLLGLGHGLLAPPALAGAVGVVPALAGAAAAFAGMLQQILGAVGAYLVGVVDNHNAANLALLMLALTSLAVVAQIALARIGPRRD